jgi:thiamine-phosphate pyrophosphorylase
LVPAKQVELGVPLPIIDLFWSSPGYGAWIRIEVYTGRMIRCAITSGVEGRAAEALLADTRRWAGEGLEFVQLREKWMEAGEMVAVAKAMVGVIREAGGRTKLLVNGRVDVAVAAGAAGVHLTARVGELSVEQVRRVFARVGSEAVVSVACHSVEEVRRAVAAGVDLILFGPVFEKRVEGVLVSGGMGLETLREACGVAGEIPVLALGGVTGEGVKRCIEVGAAGVAGIRLF